MNVVLIGMMGSGKSTVGRILAAKTGRRLVDTDRLIEKRHGPIPAIFEKSGEDGFRAIETEAVRAAAGMPNAVISTGGGTVTRRENVDALKASGKVFYLKSDAETLYARCAGTSRPLAADRERFFAIAREREPLYLAAADCVIETEGKPPKAVALEIADRLSALG